MSVKEIVHPVWGSNLTTQVSANAYQLVNGDGYVREEEVYYGFFGRRKVRIKSRYVGRELLPVHDDNAEAYRTYKYRCGLLKVGLIPNNEGPLFSVFLDGHVTSSFRPQKIQFLIAPEELKKSAGKPVADVWFIGAGRRWGPFTGYQSEGVICTFASREQMDEYLDFGDRQMPKAIRHQGVRYSVTSAGAYQAEDGSMLPHMLVMYYLLPMLAQEAFASNNPELHSLIGDSGTTVASAGTPDQSGIAPAANGAEFGNAGNGAISTSAGGDANPGVISPGFSVDGGAFGGGDGGAATGGM